MSSRGAMNTLPRFITPLVQFIAVAGVVSYTLAADSEATDTTTDWASLLVGGVVIPLVLGMSWWLGRTNRRRAKAIGLPVATPVARFANGLNPGLLALALVAAPIWVMGELVFDPMG